MQEPYNISMYYDDVFQFNSIAGNLDNITPAKLLAQSNVLAEECRELHDGINSEDLEEILDGAVDVVYVAFGVLQMLHKLGYNIDRAMAKTASNNLTKFPQVYSVVHASISDYAENGTSCSYSYNKYFDSYTIKDQNGKIRKPLGYVKNDLKDCLPKVKE